MIQQKRRRGDRMTASERKAKQAQFIETLGRTANVTAACLQVGISRSIVYIWQEMSDEFAYEFAEANKRANDVLFGEAWRRAMQGEEEPVLSGGRPVMVTREVNGRMVEVPLTIRKKSDRLLELLLKARLPEFRNTGASALVILPKEYVGFDANQDGVDS
jgi:hypothetical protein